MACLVIFFDEKKRIKINIFMKRKDIIKLEPNFRREQFAELLPPDETIGGGDGRSETSPHDFLLPYWMGRYLEIINASPSK